MQKHPQIDRARAVIFDVDGTLYSARPLRLRMLRELLRHCLTDPRRLPLLRILQVYRREREELADAEATDIISEQYNRPAARLGISPRSLAATVQPWIHQRPLRHLGALRITGIRRFFSHLRSSGKTIGVYSDYPAAEKLAALGLTADYIVTATDTEVNRLKPHPAGLEVLMSRMGANAADCLLIGDRDSRDGEAARRLEMPYLLRVGRVADEEREFSDYLQLLNSGN